MFGSASYRNHVLLRQLLKDPHAIGKELQIELCTGKYTFYDLYAAVECCSNEHHVIEPPQARPVYKSMTGINVHSIN